MDHIQSPKQFLSLPPFEWGAIPRFAVIAGPNGVGKSHLLRLLAVVSGMAKSSGPRPQGVVLKGRGVRLNQPARGGYLPALFVLPDATVDYTLFHQVTALVDLVRLKARTDPQAHEQAVATFFGRVPWDPEQPDLRQQAVAEVCKLGEHLQHEDVFRWLAPYDLIVRSDSILEMLAQMSYAYANDRVLRASASSPFRRTVSAADPVEEANRLLQLFKLPSRVVGPSEIRLKYDLRFQLPSGVLVTAGELSSGEQSIMALVGLVVTADLRVPAGDGPLLLLLDEPDAHIHTELVKPYVGALEELARRNVQIVMTTHRPETMLLCPPESLVEMRRKDGRVEFEPVPPSRRPALVARLAADTVAIMSGTRIVWVEDEDDREFHQAAYELALTFADVDLPSRPPLAFMPAMSKPDKDGKSATGATGDGGWTAVVKRMNEFRAQGMQSVFRGLVDGDNRKATLPPDVLRLDRYSIESYWADPLGLYHWAVHSDTPMGKGIAAAGEVSLEKLNDLRSLGEAYLQRAADAIIQRIEAALPDDQPRDRRDVMLYSAKGSVVLRYPEWLWTSPKRLLTDAIGKALTAGVHNGWKKALRAVGFIPADLIDIYRRLITERL